MKKFLILLFTFAGLLKGTAQQVPLYSQYYYAPMLYNPAYAGFRENTNAFLINRNQWTGISGAPATKAFTIDGALIPKKVGLGFTVYDDAVGIFERVSLATSYSYMIKFGENHTLSLGLAFDMLDNRIDYSKIDAKDQRDVTLLNAYARSMSFDGTFGAYYRYNNLELGASIPQVFAPKVPFKSDNITVYYSLSRNFIGTAKYTFRVGSEKQFKIEPMLLGQFATGVPMQLEGSVMFTYKEKIMLGLMYRDNFAFTTSIGVKLHNRITIAYAYDWITTALAPYAGGTHEVLLGYTFGKVKSESAEDKLEKRIRNLENGDSMIRRNIDTLNRKVKKNEKAIDSLERHDKQGDQEFEQFRKDMMDSLKKKNVEVNKPIPLGNIYFAKESESLLPSSYEQLKELADILIKNPNMMIEIDGYADNKGPLKYNKKLSKERADAIKHYLIYQGASASQIKAVGKGVVNPAAKNSSEEDRKLNRRVEMKVIEK